MFFSKVTTLFLLALAVGAEKKIELQDIEEDNLRSELNSDLEKDDDKSYGPPKSDSETGFNSLDFMKTGVLRFFDNSQSGPPEQQLRFVHQYAVTEQPERYGLPISNEQRPQAPQQAMVGYLSNMPMQIYLVPQYRSGQSQAPQSEQSFEKYNQNSVAHDAISGNGYEQNFVSPLPVAYLYSAQPTGPSPLTSVQPVPSYTVPEALHYDPRFLLTTNAPKSHSRNVEYSNMNTIPEIVTRTPYSPPNSPQPARYYNSRTPIAGKHKPQHPIPNLPHPNPLLLKALPSHLAHLPRALPSYRPYTKKVYQESELVSHGHETSQFKRRPNSLLDSYIPSSLQVEYLKRGLAWNPSSLYDALSNGFVPPVIPRYVEGGFLPNQMYPTAAGGVTYGHYKRNPKFEKFPHK